MENKAFQQLVLELCQTENLPQALALLQQNSDEDIAQAAKSLAGTFMVAEVKGKSKIYHSFTDTNEQGETEEFVEHVMDMGDEILKFVAWFFYSQFEIKNKDTYLAAGRTYRQESRQSQSLD